MKILLSGATGAMGHVVAKDVAASAEHSIVFGWSAEPDNAAGFPVSANLSEAPQDVDVIIDFSFHSTIKELAEFAVERGLPIVIATTGHTDDEMAVIEEAAKAVPVFHSGNMSIGVYVLKTITEQVTKMLPDFDIEVIEAHHHFKQDAPSGTAKMLVSAAKNARADLTEVYGREGHTGLRDTNEIGVHAIRGGTIVGEHTVIFAGTDEIIELKHTALSKMIFAKGAMKAARYLLSVPAGLYNMDDLNQTK